MNILHSAGDPDWYTDPRIIEAARSVFGGEIILDPMSDAVANQTVHARHIYTIADDGLAQPWEASSLFINPAGGRVGEAWNKLLEAFYVDGTVGEAIWVGFSLEQLQTLQNSTTTGMTPLDFPICIPKTRIPFVENAAKRAKRYEKWWEKKTIGVTPDLDSEGRSFPEKSSPTHANYITYLGLNPARFERIFRPIGACAGCELR